MFCDVEEIGGISDHAREFHQEGATGEVGGSFTEWREKSAGREEKRGEALAGLAGLEGEGGKWREGGGGGCELEGEGGRGEEAERVEMKLLMVIAMIVSA